MDDMIFNHQTQKYEPIIEEGRVYDAYLDLKKEVEKLRKIVNSKVLMVEDGSVDVDNLEKDGFYVIVYRNGSMPPQYLKG